MGFLRYFLLLTLVRGSVGQKCMVTKEDIAMSEQMMEGAMAGRLMEDEMVNEVFQNFRVYFGDHIDWEKLHEFNMPELYELKDIKGESNKIADEIKKEIELHSTPPIEKFRFERIFRAPLDVQSSWNEQIARYSPYVVVPLDQ